VNFADGRIKGYGIRMGPRQKTFYVLYVRGNKNYGKNDFSGNSDGTVTDRATGLVWTKEDSGRGMVWKDALSYCENLNAGGRKDWRLPNAKELQSLVDYTRAPSLSGTAAIGPEFDSTVIVNEAGQADFPYYWTSTTHASAMSGASAAYISFGRALGYMNYAWVDVHGAGAQRSDPKTGDPAAYPYGHGPQGDAIRIYNYARCVAGGAEFDRKAGTKPASASSGSVGRPGAPKEAFDACSGKAYGDFCSFSAPRGLISGVCGYGMETSLICLP